MSTPYQLGGTCFKTKEQIKRHCRERIAATDLNGTVDDPVIADLLRKHPEWNQKSHGMRRLVVDEIVVQHANVKCKAILIETADERRDITWSRLVDRLQRDGTLRHVSSRRDHLFKIKKAARAAIQYQVNKVERMPGEHIDHVYPRTFDRLLFLFLKWWGQPLESIKINDPDGDVIQIAFSDWDIETNWQMFHERLARLRSVPEAVNMAAPLYPVHWETLP